MVENMKHLILLIVSIVLFFTFPKVFLVFYLLFRYTVDLRDRISLKAVDFLLSVYVALNLAKMLSSRPYYLGSDVGYGDDIFHYHNAFEWVGNASILEFFYEYSNIVALTGSSEPLFWIFIKFITYFTSDNILIHSFITLSGLLLIYIAGEIWNRCGLLFIFLYTNTITFFALQGSGLRSGLAFSVILLGYVLFIKKGKNVLQLLAPFFHFSLIPVVVVNYIPNILKASKKIKIYSGSLMFLFISGFLYLSYKTSDSGLGSKLSSRISETLIDASSVIQFVFETIVTILFIYFFKEKIGNRNLVLSFYFFIILSFIILLLAPTGFGRFYRYEYIYFLLIYTDLFFRLNYFYRFLMLSVSLLWFFYLGTYRYADIFSGSLLEFLSLNVFF